MHAVVGKWAMDPAQRERQNQMLVEQLVPMVKQAPGFVAAYWGRAVEGQDAVSFVLFDSLDAAQRFAAYVETDPEERAHAGVEPTGWLTIVEIGATA